MGISQRRRMLTPSRRESYQHPLVAKAHSTQRERANSTYSSQDGPRLYTYAAATYASTFRFLPRPKRLSLTLQNILSRENPTERSKGYASFSGKSAVWGVRGTV